MFIIYILLNILIKFVVIKCDCFYNGVIKHYYENYTLPTRHFKCRNVVASKINESISEFRTKKLSVNVQNLTSLDVPLSLIEIIEISDSQLNLNIPKYFNSKYLYDFNLYNNNITNFSYNVFENVRDLNVLKIHHNNFNYDFDTTLFQYAPNLREIDFSYNNISMIINEFIPNNDTTDTDFLLEKLYLNNNKIHKLQSNAFNNFGFLEILNISHNPNLEIEQNAFNELIQLKTLDLSNCLEIIKRNTFNGLSELLNLNISKGFVHTLEAYSFEGLHSLINLNIEKNKVTKILTNTFKGLKNLEKLYLNNNPINYFEPGSFNGLENLIELNLGSTNIMGRLSESVVLKVVPKNLFQNLKLLNYINLSESSIDIIEIGSLNDLFSINSLNLTKNKLKYIPCMTSLSNLNNLQIIGFSENLIRNIEVCAFQNFPNLQYLFLDNNNLTSLKVETFSSLQHLIYLNLSRNNFAVFDDKVIVPLNKLVSLDLSGNNLINFNVEKLVSYLSSLEYVDLSGNNWTCTNLAYILKYLEQHHIYTAGKTIPINSKENINSIACTNENSFDVDINEQNNRGSNYTINNVINNIIDNQNKNFNKTKIYLRKLVDLQNKNTKDTKTDLQNSVNSIKHEETNKIEALKYQVEDIYKFISLNNTANTNIRTPKFIQILLL